MVAAEVIFSCGWAMIKWVGGRLPVFEVVFFRAVLSLIILTAIMLWRGSSFRGKNYKLLFTRGLFGFLGIVTSFAAMIKMNLGNASILLNTFPLFVALLAPVFIGEKFKHINFIFVVTAFAGISLIIKPTQHIFHNMAFLGLLSGICAAFSVISVRRLTLTDSSSVITFYFTLITTLASIPFIAGKFVMPTTFEWLLLAGIGTAVTVGQLLMAKAYSYAHAATVSPFAYISVLGAYIFGIIIWKEVPDILSIIGCVLIVIAGVAITITEGRIKQISPT
jgi:drug/metabolite transporter (DMT)-like permease